MKQVQLGRTGLVCSQIGLELSPIRQYSFAESRDILQQAIQTGVTFFDLGLPDRETQKRIARGIAGSRDQLVLAGSFVPSTVRKLETDLEWMLRDLKTDYLDLLQIHDPDVILRPGETSGLYDQLLKIQEKGYIRYIGITTGDPRMAMDALEYGWYDTIQYPWGPDSTDSELTVLSYCAEAEVGSISVPDGRFSERKQRWARHYPQHLMLYMLDPETIFLP